MKIISDCCDLNTAYHGGKIMKKSIILTFVLLCFYSCVYDRVERFQLVNYSDNGQVICYTCSDSIGSKTDSLTNNPYFKQFDYFKSDILDQNVFLNRNSYTSIGVSGKKEFIVRRCEDKRIRFFFISDSVFMNNPWDTIVKYQMYNRKLIFSEEDLKENDWIVVYE